VVDDPELCNFIVPAIVRKGALQIAVSTGGKSPSLARRIKKDLAGSLDAAYGRYLEFVGELRREICGMECSSAGERMGKLRLLADERIFRVFKKRGKRAARKEAKKLTGI
jgi:precorrin-2 dehydrogenase/sirohydrochlorin ferrochelatase